MTPTEQEVKAGAARKTVEDVKGRKLTVERVKPSAYFDLLAAAGDKSANSAWLLTALRVVSVVEIDGVPVLRPETPDEIKALADRLEWQGLAAVQDAMKEIDAGESPDSAKN